MLNPFKRKKKESAGGLEPMEGPSFGPSGPPRPPERRIVPTDEVRALASRGVPEPDIIRTLRREGYATTEIDQAMKEALRRRVSGDFYDPRGNYEEAPAGPPEPIPRRGDIPRNLAYPGSEDMEEPEPRMPPTSYDLPEEEPEFPETPSGDYFTEPAPRRVAPSRAPLQRSGVDRREIEELAEVIVDEKLRDVRERFKAIDSQFQQVTRKIEIFSEEMNRIRSEKSGEVKGIESKIDSYSRNMDEISGRMVSMEKALRDSLSPMLESLRSLSELVKSMKEKNK